MIRINLLPFRDARKKENVRRQVSYFVLCLVLLGSLAAAVHAGLSGDLTAPFAMKLGVVVSMAGLVFLAYRAELAGHGAGRAAGWAIAAVALAGIGAGLWLSGGPGEGRAERRDALRQGDLAALAAQAQCLAAEGRAVPPLAPTEGCPATPRLADPATGEAYGIEPVEDGRLRLCAARETAETYGWPGASDPARPGCIVIDLRQPGRAVGPSLVPEAGGLLAE